MTPFYESKQDDIYVNPSRIGRFPMHLHIYTELVYVMEGQATISVNNQAYTLHQGDLILIFPNVIHAYIDSSENSRTVTIIISPNMLSELFFEMAQKIPENPLIPACSLHQDAVYAIEKIMHEVREVPGSNMLACKAFVQLLFARTLGSMTFKNQKEISGGLLEKVISYICAHYREPVSLESTAHQVGVSRYHISRLFNQKIGISFSDYLNNLRIQQAKTLLRGTDLPIGEIALECGFENHRSFDRTFKKICNISPVCYRGRNT